MDETEYKLWLEERAQGERFIAALHRLADALEVSAGYRVKPLVQAPAPKVELPVEEEVKP